MSSSKIIERGNFGTAIARFTNTRELLFTPVHWGGRTTTFEQLFISHFHLWTGLDYSCCSFFSRIFFTTMDSQQLIDAQFDRAVEIVQGLPKTGPIQTTYEDKLTMYR